LSYCIRIRDFICILDPIPSMTDAHFSLDTLLFGAFAAAASKTVQFNGEVR